MHHRRFRLPCLFSLLFICIIAFSARPQWSASAQSATVTPSPSPLPAPTLPYNERFEGLPVSTAPSGYPQIGYPNAPVSVTVYASFDETPLTAQAAPATPEPTPSITTRTTPSSTFFAAGQAERSGFDVLLQRARNAEVLITYLPVVHEGTPNGRGAARAALCAGEQGAFWPYAELLFTWARDAELADDTRLAGSRLIEAVNTLGLDQSRWNECMVSQRPDTVLAEADAQRAGNTLYTGTPFVVVGTVVANPDALSLDLAVTYAVSEANADFERALAELEAQAANPEATAEITPEVVTLEPLMGDQIPPPFTIALPEGWLTGLDVLVLRDIDGIRNIPFAIYQGPVTGGMGTIVVLWGFPNLIAGNLDAAITGAAVTPDLYSDGSRLLRLAVVEQGCNVGTDLRRSYPVGGLEAIGTQFAAVDCPELPDTRGWYAGLQQYGLNFVFYAYSEPIEAANTAETDLQAILDTVTFVLPIATPTPVP